MSERKEDYVKLENVSKIYGSKEVKIVAVDEISFQIAEGEFVVIVGPVSYTHLKNQKTGVEPPKELHTKVSVKTVVVVFASMLLIIYFCVNGVIKKTLKLEPIRVLSMIE